MMSLISAISGLGRYLEAMAVCRPKARPKWVTNLAAPSSGAHDDDVLALAEGGELLDEQGQRFEHLDGQPAVETADLGAVRIPDDQAVDAGGNRQVGHQPGRGRLALELGRLVLPGVGQVRQDRRDMVGPVLAERSGGDEQGHHILVDAPVRRRIESRLERGKHRSR